jgi:prevent-host-death family protein
MSCHIDIVPLGELMAHLSQVRSIAFERTRHIGAREARAQFADLLGQVHYGGETVIIERAGKPMAALVPLEVVEQYLAARERLFAVVDEIRNQAPAVPVAEVQQDVDEALAAVRAAKRSGNR